MFFFYFFPHLPTGWRARGLGGPVWRSSAWPRSSARACLHCARKFFFLLPSLPPAHGHAQARPLLTRPPACLPARSRRPYPVLHQEGKKRAAHKPTGEEIQHMRSISPAAHIDKVQK